MATASTLPLTPRYRISAKQTATLYLREIWYEFLRALRNKSFSLGILCFPTMFYVLFGISNRGQSIAPGVSVAKYLLAAYAGFGTVGAALFGIGVGLAFERSSGWLDLKRASPMPPLCYLVARCAMAVMFSLAVVTILCTLGITAGGVHITWSEYGRLMLVAAIGSLPFAAMGLMLASFLPPNSAPGIVNLVYLPMSYASGLWMPVWMLPKIVQHIAPWLPTYHLAQLMLHAVDCGSPTDRAANHAIALTGFALLFLGLGWLGFSRTEEA